MATPPRTPGVYIEEVSKFPPSIAQVQTAIPAFIGYTEKAENNGKPLAEFTPIRITSLLEYETFFGKDQREAFIVVDIKSDPGGAKYSVSFEMENNDPKKSRYNLYRSLQLFYLNGGGPCYIISTGGYLPTVNAPFENPTASFTKALEALEKLDEPTLIVFPDGQNMDRGSYFTILNLALAQAFKLKDRFVIMDLHVSGEKVKTSNDLFSIVVGSEGVIVQFRGAIANYFNYGAAYFPNIISDFNYSYDPANPGKVKKDGVEVPFGDLTSLERSAVKLAIDNAPIIMPPSGAIAGIYARVDNNRGVWKAPANEGISGVSGLAFDINDQLQENLNVDDTAGKSINAIRFFSGKGVKVWGARTLDGSSNEWRYVPVRRFFIMVEESAKKATDAFVFEPNDANTWVKVRAMIENFLLLQWRAGALAGAKPEHAFYVKVGLNETMTAQDILEGRMIVEIGMAVVRPAEFIILRFSHKMQES